MEKKDTTSKRRLCELEDEDVRIEGIFEEEIVDTKKQCQEAATKKKLDNACIPKVHKNKARS